jgi:transcription elongation factor GreA
VPQRSWMAGSGHIPAHRRGPAKRECDRRRAQDTDNKYYNIDTILLEVFDMKKVPLTVAGAGKLKEELHRLKTVDRPRVIQAIAEARAHGDLSENAEYHAAKEQQSFIEGRIAEVDSKLSNAQIIDPKTVNAEGRVVFGATVQLLDEDSGKEMTYQIVGDDEADIAQGMVSISSPIARALIGKESGESVEVRVPDGARRYEILNVSY